MRALDCGFWDTDFWNSNMCARRVDGIKRVGGVNLALASNQNFGLLPLGDTNSQTLPAHLLPRLLKAAEILINTRRKKMTKYGIV